VIGSLFHINLCVADMARSVRFYRELGFAVVAEMFPEGPELGTPLGIEATRLHTTFLRLPGDEAGPMLDLVQFLEPPATAPPYSTAHALGIARIAFWSSDLEGTLSTAVRAGAALVADPFTMPGPGGQMMQTACFTDPDGIVLQVFGASAA
jgi:catechol 2,3-dioxygenase-like lactoylglutathione lyase family enzyme